MASSPDDDPEIRAYILSQEARKREGEFFIRAFNVTSAPNSIGTPSAAEYRTAIAPKPSTGDEALLGLSIQTYHAVKVEAVLGAMGIGAAGTIF